VTRLDDDGCSAVHEVHNLLIIIHPLRSVISFNQISFSNKFNPQTVGVSLVQNAYVKRIQLLRFSAANLSCEVCETSARKIVYIE